MKIEDLISTLEHAYQNSNRELNVVIPICDPGTVGGSPFVNIESLGMGFDWDAGKVFLMPEKQLTPLTPEQVKEIHESVSRGQSWHAYEKWKKDKEERKALESRVAALEAVCREIVESAPKDLGPGDTKTLDFSSLYRGTERQKYFITQKLKAVLEEA